MSDDFSDIDDWARAQSGDAEAFGRVFSRHQARVFRHCLRLLPDLEDARDAVASTFLEAWRRRGAVRMVEGSVIGWLLVTATNVSRNLVRSRRRYSALLASLPRPVADELGSSTNEVSSSVRAAVASLPSRQRDVVTLCLLEGFSEADAAASLQVARGTVKSRLSRARAALRVSLGDESFSPIPVSEGLK
jgi:RNA polymerase sigma-70 factor (ECF subfamily)